MQVAQLETAGIATTSMKLDFWTNRKKHLGFKMNFYYFQLRLTARINSPWSVTVLKSIQIQKFRILNQLSQLDLHRINLIAGLNGCGKTSLLEAIFLLSGAGNPQLIMLPDLMRGVIPSFGAWAKSEGPWRELFSNGLFT